ncbi:hypothetical protein [Mycoplasmopsis cynos]|uniref:Uncharacterized protein n=1 Tax=Mycoplasmopsis cynos TaxID=171284 RepID=A0ABD8AID7_9BACT|nr:hypothetical protein [Mycoplasmopsis cynos]MCU9935419.1 hypothetical protein [Mycoplasmopsis cynos]UWV80375.1 hypothetical protein NW069_03475 [Mycoplasmopsis cynos]UWV86489.1 hypothetical protein NW063_02065 [Mycoplasmopsis cynos]WAM05863.1 hypothetical protein OM999_01195 [Mycoplasmopsis cynos]WAM08872.1 hypothetical protein ONA03_00455 [Mycoplasmopsis cynos]
MNKDKQIKDLKNISITNIVLLLINILSLIIFSIVLGYYGAKLIFATSNIDVLNAIYNISLAETIILFTIKVAAFILAIISTIKASAIAKENEKIKLFGLCLSFAIVEGISLLLFWIPVAGIFIGVIAPFILGIVVYSIAIHKTKEY